MRSAGRALATVAATAALAMAPLGSAQQLLEIDFENGRAVIDDDFRAIRFSPVAFDHARRAIYVRDLEEPDGIMVFSIETGEWLRTHRIAKGEGPRELREFRGFALSSSAGLHVLGVTKTLLLDSIGAFDGYWQFGGPSAQAICEFGGQPTVAVQGGLKRRGASGGEDDYFGDPVVAGETWVRGPDAGLSEVLKWRDAAVACRQDAAYLVLPNEQFELVQSSQTTGELRNSDSGPDSVLVYHDDGRVRRLNVPSEFAEEHGWNRGLMPSIDAEGDLVLASLNGFVPGAIVDPETGCYGVFRNREYELYRVFVGIHNDSAVVFHRDREEMTRDGRRQVTIYSEARQVSLHPIRRVSGEPCPGMLPSVRGDDARDRGQSETPIGGRSRSANRG